MIKSICNKKLRKMMIKNICNKKHKNRIPKLRTKPNQRIRDISKPRLYASLGPPGRRRDLEASPARGSGAPMSTGADRWARGRGILWTTPVIDVWSEEGRRLENVKEGEDGE